VRRSLLTPWPSVIGFPILRARTGMNVSGSACENLLRYIVDRVGRLWLGDPRVDINGPGPQPGR